MQISKTSLEFDSVSLERAQLQTGMGAKIRNYATLQFFLREREKAYQERLSTLRNVSSQYSDQGEFQEDLGRTISFLLIWRKDHFLRGFNCAKVF